MYNETSRITKYRYCFGSSPCPNKSLSTGTKVCITDIFLFSSTYIPLVFSAVSIEIGWNRFKPNWFISKRIMNCSVIHSVHPPFCWEGEGRLNVPNFQEGRVGLTGPQFLEEVAGKVGVTFFRGAAIFR